jgi:hypothetical protein
MMKKLLSFIVIAVATSTAAFAQCTPDISCIPVSQAYGICPDSATGMAAGTVGVPYTQVMSMKVPANGSDFGYPLATIVSIDITSVDSLAPGLTYTCVPAGCSFPGSSNGCILITGTPTTPWNKQVIVNAMAHATIAGFPASLPQTNKQYRSIVNPNSAGIENLNMNKFDVMQNSPNPFSDKTQIFFSTVAAADVDFKVFNMLGEVVTAKTIKAERGLNTIELDATTFAPGIYVYAIRNAGKTITKRMIVTGK